jgi:hypothetical protein
VALLCVSGKQQLFGWGGVRGPQEGQRKDGLAAARLGPGTQAGAAIAIARDNVIATLNNLLFKRQAKIHGSVS